MINKSDIKIGYALGGGGAPGLSHIGVLKVLEEYGISPCTIAGTSIGAIIGALYAGGLKATDIEHLALKLDWKRLALMADFTIPFNGLFQGRRVTTLLESILGNSNFSQLKCDFACVSTDILTGERIALYDGSLVEAIRASISVPGIFTPVKINGRYLVDGGLVNEIPVSVCRERGADYVIGVNVIPEPGKNVLSSKKGRKSQDNKIPILDHTLDEVTSNTQGSHLRARIDTMEKSINSFLLYHNPNKKKRTPGQLDSLRTDKPGRFLARAPTLLDVLSQSVSIAEYTIAIDNLKDANLAISPDVESIGFWQFSKAAQAIAAGEEAARRALQLSNLADVLSGRP